MIRLQIYNLQRFPDAKTNDFCTQRARARSDPEVFNRDHHGVTSAQFFVRVASSPSHRVVRIDRSHAERQVQAAPALATLLELAVEL